MTSKTKEDWPTVIAIGLSVLFVVLCSSKFIPFLLDRMTW